jgi:putative ABC transport system ATP-binding protein
MILYFFMLTLSHITKRYTLGQEVWEMKDLNLEIQANSFVAITGVSGAGKSTLLHLCGGLDFPQAGEVKIDGVVISTMRDQELSRYRNKKMGFVFQHFYLYPDIDLIENVSLPLMIAGVPFKKRQREAGEALSQVGLQGLEKHAIHQISGGQRQRVAIARAIVNNPQILLADEPTGNLDTKTGQDIIALLQTLRQKNKMTLVIVTHDDYIVRQAQRKIELKEGRIVFDQ